MSKVLLSVIIPIYNSEKYLKRCIDSILTQSFSVSEIILVNDGSKDKSAEICGEYSSKDKRIKVFHQINAGVSCARNRGLEIAKGEWIYFLDSDDTLEKGAFDVFLTEHKFLGVDMIQFGYRRIFNKSKVVEYGSMEEKVYTDINQYYAISNFTNPPLWVHFIKKSIVAKNKIRFSEGIHFGEDSEFTTKCYLVSKKVLTLNKKYYNYYYNEGSATTKEVDLANVIGHTMIVENLKTFIQANNEVSLYPDFIQKSLVNLIKTYLVKVSMHPDWYYNLSTYQKGYNQMLNQSESILGIKLNTFFFSINRISIVPCVLCVKLILSIRKLMGTN